jgi:hypothetical protein
MSLGPIRFQNLEKSGTVNGIIRFGQIEEDLVNTRPSISASCISSFASIMAVAQLLPLTVCTPSLGKSQPHGFARWGSTSITPNHLYGL